MPGHIDITANTAHPRSRGEHPGWDEYPNFDFGSSPLARGTQIKELEKKSV